MSEQESQMEYQSNARPGPPLGHDDGRPHAADQNNATGAERPDGNDSLSHRRPVPPSTPDQQVNSSDGGSVDGFQPAPDMPPLPSRSVVVTVSDPLGLHLRSGRDLVRTASRFQAQITASNLSRESHAVDLKSILQLMQLQARQGHDLQLEASGPDAAAAIDALRTLF